MRASFLSLFGAEWFGASIATLALAQVYILAYGLAGATIYRSVGEALFLLGVSLFLILFVLWALGGILLEKGIRSHWDNITRMSFTALIPIIGFVANYQAIYFFGLSPMTAQLSLINFYVDYGLAFGLGVLLGYRLYTKVINPKEINYAIIIPPLSIGTSVFLATPLVQYYGASQGSTIGFLGLMGFGIFFLLYVVIGALALSGHVTTKSHETLPTTMLPVGVASLVILNLFALPYLGSYIHVSLPLSSVYLLSIMLWGFEVWNFLVVALIILTRPSWGTLGIWAYGFPLGLFSTSTLRLAEYADLPALRWVFWISVVVINSLWAYAWVNTYIFTWGSARRWKIAPGEVGEAPSEGRVSNG